MVFLKDIIHYTQIATSRYNNEKYLQESATDHSEPEARLEEMNQKEYMCHSRACPCLKSRRVVRVILVHSLLMKRTTKECIYACVRYIYTLRLCYARRDTELSSLWSERDI